MSDVVALTGATGFIGRTILSSLSDRGIPVRALCRQPQTSTVSTTWIQGHLGSERALNSLLEGASVVIHCAGNVRGKSLEEFTDVNTTGTKSLLSACSQQNRQLRFLFFSSLAAREPHLSWYARSKALAEELVQAADTLEWTIFRPTAVYGQGDREILPLLKLLHLGLLPAPNSKCRFSLLHIVDLLDAVSRWLENDRSHKHVFELDDGTSSGYTWKYLQEQASQIRGKSVIRLPIPVSVLRILAALNLGTARLLGYSPMLTPGKVNEIVHPDWRCDITRAADELGWQPKIRLVDAMRDSSLLQL